jgi:UDP-glucose 4-epimerase
MKKKSVKGYALVTGGAGFVGSHVVDELVRLKRNVIVLDDLSGGFVENINPKARFIKGSVTDKVLVGSIFAEHDIDYVFHLAAYAAEGLSHFIRKFNYENNLIGSINLINASVKHGVKCFVFTSSIAVYGKGQLPMKETMMPMPEDPYGISKLAVELDLRAAHEMFGLNYVIFRPHNIYGERQNVWDKYRNVVGIFMRQIMEGEPLTIFGDGTQTRAFSYVKDVAPVIARAAFMPKAYGNVFNVGADKPYSLNQLAAEVSKVMGVKQPIRRLPARNEVKHAHSTHAKAAKYFGHKPKYDLQAGLKATAAWVRATVPQESRIFAEVELAKNMPPAWSELLKNQKPPTFV